MIKLSLICTPGIQNSAQLRTHTHLPPWEKPNLVVPAIVVGWPSCLDHKHFLLLLHSTHRIGFHLNPHFHFMKLILLLHLATQKVVSTMASLILPSVFPSFSLLLANQFLPPPYSYQCFSYSQSPLSLQSHISSPSIDQFFCPCHYQNGCCSLFLLFPHYCFFLQHLDFLISRFVNGSGSPWYVTPP